MIVGLINSGPNFSSNFVQILSVHYNKNVMDGDFSPVIPEVALVKWLYLSDNPQIKIINWP